MSLIAKRLGENDLDSPVHVEGPAEMRALSQVFDEMRIRLHTAREELKQWNATLEQRIAQRTLELETLNEVSREISSRRDIQQVLDSVTEKARALLGGEIASLCLVDENQHWLRLQTVSGPKEAVTGQVAALNEGLAANVLTNQEALLCGTGACQGGCRMLTEKYRASHVAAPLRVGERVIGALCVGSPSQNQFAVEAGGMMTKLANVAVAEFSRSMVLDLVQLAERPDYVKVKQSEEQGTEKVTRRTSWGTIPDFTAETKEGVKINTVKKYGPADKAGMKDGDIIVEIAGTKITNLYDYNYLMDIAGFGKPVEVAILRNGKRETLTIVPAARK